MTDFEDLYQRYAADVFRFALYLSGNRADADDITSETFVRVWTSATPIRTETVKGYLCTIARHLFLEGVRRQARHVELSPDLRDDAPGPGARTEGRDEWQRVMTGLQALPEIDRAALLMRALEELPYDEIARALGISVASAKVKVHRARLRLAIETEPAGVKGATS